MHLSITGNTFKIILLVMKMEYSINVYALWFTRIIIHKTKNTESCIK